MLTPLTGYLTTDQATQEAAAILEAAGLTGKRQPAVSSRIGMQPAGARELVETEVTVRKAEDYCAAIEALLRDFPGTEAYAADQKRSMRFYRRTGRIVGGAEDGGRTRPDPAKDRLQPAAGPIMPAKEN